MKLSELNLVIEQLKDLSVVEACLVYGPNLQGALYEALEVQYND